MCPTVVEPAASLARCAPGIGRSGTPRRGATDRAAARAVRAETTSLNLFKIGNHRSSGQAGILRSIWHATKPDLGRSNKAVFKLIPLFNDNATTRSAHANSNLRHAMVVPFVDHYRRLLWRRSRSHRPCLPDQYRRIDPQRRGQACQSAPRSGLPPTWRGDRHPSPHD